MGQGIGQLVQKLLVHYDDDWRFTLVKSWATIVGPLSQYTRLDRIEGSMVIVGVYDPHWMQELHLLTPTLIASINTHLKKNVISNVKFKLVERKVLGMNSPKKKSASHEQVLQIMPKLTAHQQQALMDIKDPELKQALLDYYAYLKKGQSL